MVTQLSTRAHNFIDFCFAHFLSSFCSAFMMPFFFFFFTPGVIHLLTNMLFQVPVGVLIEREIGYVNRTNERFRF